MKLVHRLSVSSLAAFALALAGCSNSFSSICDKVQECSGGNDNDVNACAAQGDALASVAGAYGCADQFATWSECYDLKGTCKNGNYGAECDDERDALRKCQEAASAIDGDVFDVKISSGACKEYGSLAKKCTCGSLSEAAKKQCEKTVDEQLAALGDGADAACQAAIDVLKQTCN